MLPLEGSAMLFVILLLRLSLTAGAPMENIINGFLNRTVGSIGHLGLADGIEAFRVHPQRTITSISMGKINLIIAGCLWKLLKKG